MRGWGGDKKRLVVIWLVGEGGGERGDIKEEGWLNGGGRVWVVGK